MPIALDMTYLVENCCRIWKWKTAAELEKALLSPPGDCCARVDTIYEPGGGEKTSFWPRPATLAALLLPANATLENITRYLKEQSFNLKSKDKIILI